MSNDHPDSRRSILGLRQSRSAPDDHSVAVEGNPRDEVDFEIFKIRSRDCQRSGKLRSSVCITVLCSIPPMTTLFVQFNCSRR